MLLIKSHVIEFKVNECSAILAAIRMLTIVDAVSFLSLGQFFAILCFSSCTQIHNLVSNGQYDHRILFLLYCLVKVSKDNVREQHLCYKSHEVCTDLDGLQSINNNTNSNHHVCY